VTCIVGLAENESVWIGADSAAVQGYTARSGCIRKAFRVSTTARETFLIGYAGSFRMGQLLQYRLDVTQPCGDDPWRYLATTFIDVVRALFKDHGYATVESNRESGGPFLLGFRGGLYSVDPDYQVNKMHDGFDAIGCGDEYALGAMQVTRGQEPSSRVLGAIAAAGHFSAGVKKPYIVECLDPTNLPPERSA
jgi:ATP-dependent protease HslVU (ClpYQ) peptidase subunit